MKSVLISIQPQWCKLIFNGQKIIEVRKTRPLIDMPFKVYVYCTKQKLTKKECMHSYLHKNEPKACKKYGEITTWCSIGDVHVNSNTPWSFRSYGMHGKVIGSFVCDKIDEYEANERGWYIYPQDETCLLCDEIAHYGKGKPLYGWHITAPKLFDKPRELSEFGITRAPMSWCYVEQAP